MKTSRVFGMVAVALVAGMAYTPAVQAQLSAAKAKAFKSDLVRAMDQCVTLNSVTVVSPGAVEACPEMHVITDGTVTGFAATLAVGKGKDTTTGDVVGSLSIKGKGFPVGAQLGVQLTIRTTNSSGSPAGSKTYQDETIMCGTTPGGACGNSFTVDVKGKVKGKQTLPDCLTANNLPTALGAGNIEVLDAAVVDCATGLVIAVPGTLQPTP